ncbi:O-antigen ligase family protein [Patescibacteria group bacterium]
MKNLLNSKNSVFLFEVVFLLLSVFNVFPREAVLVITGIMIFYFIFAPLEDSIWLFVASIPLFAALPISENFDQMANWRIFLAILFLVLFFRVGISISLVKNKFGKWRLREDVKHDQMEYLAGILIIIIACLSLFVADDVFAGIKKILFLVNIFLLFIIIRNLTARNKNFIFELIGAIKIGIATVLIAGFAQLVFVFFVQLHIFWKFWAYKIIPIFYGQSLGNLLAYSNTWFSYHAYQTSTLRMFSIFPDSHSFGLFCILALPFFLTSIFLRKAGDKKKFVINYLLLIICLMAILFSGSRGIWVSAVGSLIIFLFFILLSYSPTLRSRKNFFITKFTHSKNWWNFFQLSIGCIMMLIFLLPISSKILFLSQEIQLDTDMSEISLFGRTKSIFDFSEISVKSRLQIWQKTVDSIIAHPFLGVGIGNYPLILGEDISFAKRGSSAHNLYLDVASEMGIFALIILLVIFYFIFKSAWEVFNNSNNLYLKYWAGFFVLALIWILGYSLFDIVLLNDKVLLFFMANLGVLYAAKSSIGICKHSNL